MTLANQLLQSDNDNYEDQLHDEDITIKGTPLHDYLHSLCLNDEEGKVDCKTNPIVGGSYVCRFWHGVSVKEYLQTQWKLCRATVSDVFPITDDVLVKMSQYYHAKYGREILESKVMLEEDLDYLCLQTPRQFLNCIKKKEHEVFSITDSVKHGHVSRHFMLISCYVACLVAFLLTPLVPTVIHVCLAFLTFFVTCFNLRLQIIIEMWKRNHNRNLAQLHQFLESSEKFHSVVRRAIRLVQDMEVVSRGYTLANGKTPISRMETSNPQSPRAFPKLRLTLLRSLVKCILSCREAMRNLMQYKLPNDCCSDLDAYSICSVPLSELGVCFSEETSEVELYSATDGYALSVLKTLNEILFKQRSEFLTRLSLTLSGTTWNFLPEGFLAVFPSMLSNPHQAASDSLVSVQSSYEMHKHVTSAKDEDKNTKLENTDEKRKVASTLRINLHSMQTHMRAAMYKSLEIEDSVLELKKTKLEITDLFENLKMHLNVTLECWNQCIKEVDLFYRRQMPSDGPHHGDGITMSLKNNEELSANNKEDEVEIVDYEENTEDQVFEATNEGQTGDDRNFNHYENDTSEKTVLEESATVIRELRSVLAVKTSEKQREMWKRQLFPSYKPTHYKEKTEENTSLDNLTKEETSMNPCDGCSGEKSDIPVLQNNFDFSVSHSDNMVDYSQPKCLLTDEGSEEPLSFHKRPTHPGRPPTSRNYKHKPGDTYMPPTECEADSLSRKPNLSSEVGDQETISADSQETTVDWTTGLGIGFSSSLAMQAVSIARKRNPVVANVSAVTYGSDSSDDN